MDVSETPDAGSNTPKIDVSKTPDAGSSPKITSEKPKDPRRVEAGKRLAAISRQAKEKKKKERIEAEKVDGPISRNYLLASIGLLVGVISLYYNYKDDKREENKAVATREVKTVTVTKVLDSLE